MSKETRELVILVILFGLLALFTLSCASTPRMFKMVIPQMVQIEKPFVLNLVYMGDIAEDYAINVLIYVGGNLKATRIFQNPVGHEYPMRFNISTIDYWNAYYGFREEPDATRDINEAAGWDERIDIYVEFWLGEPHPYDMGKFIPVKLLGKDRRKIKVFCPNCMRQDLQ